MVTVIEISAINSNYFHVHARSSAVYKSNFKDHEANEKTQYTDN